MRLYRIYARKHHETAFTGEGARQYGGRWNSPGVPVVYVATSFALGLLEVMANTTGTRMPAGMVYCTVDIPEGVACETLGMATLPLNWYEFPAPPELQAAGDAWIRRGETVALIVPSALARIEHNVLLNPAHHDFAHLLIGNPMDIPVDRRISALPQRKKKS